MTQRLEWFGLENALLPLGRSFFEVVSPIKADSAGARFLDRHGDAAGYMLEVQVPDILKVEKNLSGQGVKIVHRPGRVGDDEPGSDWTGLNDPGLTGIHWHPREMGCIVETAQHSPPENWLYAGSDWQDELETRSSSVFPDGSGVGVRFCGADLAVDDPAATATRWCDGLGAIRISETEVRPYFSPPK